MTKLGVAGLAPAGPAAPDGIEETRYTYTFLQLVCYRDVFRAVDITQRCADMWGDFSDQDGRPLAESTKHDCSVQRPGVHDQPSAEHDDDARERQAEAPVVAEPVSTGSHHEQVVLMADRR